MHSNNLANHDQEIELTQSVAKTHKATFQEKLSDNVAATVGSWKFIVIQSCLITVWIFCNVNIPVEGMKIGTFTLHAWDPYPFIFLNLTLSFQAAYTAPIIMMSQNRQSQKDREDAEDDYRINREAKMEVELIKIEMRKIHAKLLKHHEIQEDMAIISTEIQTLKKILDKKIK
jgi:uncharacterized membrane protein